VFVTTSVGTSSPTFRIFDFTYTRSLGIFFLVHVTDPTVFLLCRLRHRFAQEYKLCKSGVYSLLVLDLLT
jgi:hypothetical protein